METQKSISDWANHTFGQPGSNLRVATRAGEEIFELFKEMCQASPDYAKLVEEAADVAIVLYRLCDRLGFLVDTSIIRREDPANAKLFAAQANAQIASVIVRLIHQDNDVSARYNLLQTYYFLEQLCLELGYNLNEQVETKMVINRQRKWNVGNDGHGYHVKEST